MTIDQVISTAMGWAHKLIGIALLILIAATMAKYYGIRLPVHTPGHVELAYLCGAYWLARGAKV